MNVQNKWTERVYSLNVHTGTVSIKKKLRFQLDNGKIVEYDVPENNESDLLKPID